MCLCLFSYLYLCPSMCKCMYISACIYTYICMCVHVSVRVCMSCVRVCMYMHMHISTCVCMRMCVYICESVRVMECNASEGSKKRLAKTQREQSSCHATNYSSGVIFIDRQRWFFNGTRRPIRFKGFWFIHARDQNQQK